MNVSIPACPLSKSRIGCTLLRNSSEVRTPLRSAEADERRIPPSWTRRHRLRGPAHTPRVAEGFPTTPMLFSPPAFPSRPATAHDSQVLSDIPDMADAQNPPRTRRRSWIFPADDSFRPPP